MGTYTTNYNLFMPSIGEQGWGELVNGNFVTIDATMKGFDDVLSKMTWDGDDITFPGNISSKGGITVDYIGFNGVLTTNNNGYAYATSSDVGISWSSSVKTITPTVNYTYNPLPIKISDGLYFVNVDASSFNMPSTITLNVRSTQSTSWSYFYIKKSSESNYTKYSLSGTSQTSPSANITLNVGESYDYYVEGTYFAATLKASPTYYITYKTP